MQIFFSPAGSYLLVHQPMEEKAPFDQAKHICASLGHTLQGSQTAALEIHITACTNIVLPVSSDYKKYMV